VQSSVWQAEPEPSQPGENSEAANSFLIYWMLLVTFVFLCERDSS
jgi:hypothetical protein